MQTRPQTFNRQFAILVPLVRLFVLPERTVAVPLQFKLVSFHPKEVDSLIPTILPTFRLFDLGDP